MKLDWRGDELKKKVNKEIIENLYKAAYIVNADEKRLCPVDKGRLRASCDIDVDESELKAYVTAGGEVDESQVHTERGRAMSGTPVEYAVYVELGTSKMAAQPFLRPALEMNKATIRKLFDNG